MTHFWPPSVESALWSYSIVWSLVVFSPGSISHCITLCREALVVKYAYRPHYVSGLAAATSVEWERKCKAALRPPTVSVDGRETTTVTETWETERDAHKYFDTGNQATSAAHESATLTTYSSASITRFFTYSLAENNLINDCMQLLRGYRAHSSGKVNSNSSLISVL